MYWPDCADAQLLTRLRGCRYWPGSSLFACVLRSLRVSLPPTQMAVSSSNPVLHPYSKTQYILSFQNHFRTSLFTFNKRLTMIVSDRSERKILTNHALWCILDRIRIKAKEVFEVWLLHNYCRCHIEYLMRLFHFGFDEVPFCDIGVYHLTPIWCLRNAVLRDCGILWVFSYLLFYDIII